MRVVDKRLERENDNQNAYSPLQIVPVLGTHFIPPSPLASYGVTGETKYSEVSTLSSQTNPIADGMCPIGGGDAVRFCKPKIGNY